MRLSMLSFDVPSGSGGGKNVPGIVNKANPFAHCVAELSYLSITRLACFRVVFGFSKFLSEFVQHWEWECGRRIFMVRANVRATVSLKALVRQPARLIIAGYALHGV